MREIESKDDLAFLVKEYGMLPLLKNRIDGFSVEDHTPSFLWFTDVPGPWEWKGPVIKEIEAAYGKFFNAKAGFIRKDLYPYFSLIRRKGMALFERYSRGEIRHIDKIIYDALLDNPESLSKSLRAIAGISKRSEFDASITRLQMLGYVITIDFVYPETRDGKEYGWGIARYDTPEHYYDDFESTLYSLTIDDARDVLSSHLRRVLPDVSEKTILKILG